MATNTAVALVNKQSVSTPHHLFNLNETLFIVRISFITFSVTRPQSIKIYKLQIFQEFVFLQRMLDAYFMKTIPRPPFQFLLKSPARWKLLNQTLLFSRNTKIEVNRHVNWKTCRFQELSLYIIKFRGPKNRRLF